MKGTHKAVLNTVKFQSRSTRGRPGQVLVREHYFRNDLFPTSFDGKSLSLKASHHLVCDTDALMAYATLFTDPQFTASDILVLETALNDIYQNGTQGLIKNIRKLLQGSVSYSTKGSEAFQRRFALLHNEHALASAATESGNPSARPLASSVAQETETGTRNSHFSEAKCLGRRFNELAGLLYFV